MHVRLGDVLDHDRDIIVPCTNRLVVTRRHESSIFVNERDGVDGSKMLVVFLCDFSSAEIVLWTQVSVFSDKTCATHLNNLLVRHSGQEYMLLVLIWVELDNIRNFAVAKRLNTLTCGSVSIHHRCIPTGLTRLGIPQLDLPIVTRTEELSAVIVKVDILDGLGVAHECTQAVAVVVDVP